MEKLISACGLLCNECPAYQVHLKDDQELREKTAETWSQAYNTLIEASNIYCVGCTTQEGEHFGHCSNCYMRKCSTEKGHTTCAECAEYPCEALDEFFHIVPPAKDNLDSLRK